MLPTIAKERSNVRELKLLDCFTKGTWTALGLSLLSFSVDAYVVIYIPLHRSGAELDLYHPSALFTMALRTVEVALALLSLWLLRYAFSRPPRFPASVVVSPEPLHSEEA